MEQLVARWAHIRQLPDVGLETCSHYKVHLK